MLSRTADHLYWLARCTERAENMARLLDASYQMSMVPQPLAVQNETWRAILALNSQEEAFAQAYDAVNAENVLRFTVVDAANPSSIYSCLRAARENAHAVRGTLTAEVEKSRGYIARAEGQAQAQASLQSKDSPFAALEA